MQTRSCDRRHVFRIVERTARVSRRTESSEVLRSSGVSVGSTGSMVGRERFPGEASGRPGERRQDRTGEISR